MSNRKSIETSIRVHNRIGFTLVELMVVVAIIVLLMALLVPALDKAMAATKKAICLANLHVWGLGMQQYSLDHKRSVVYIPQNSPRGTYWYDTLAPYVGEPNWDPDRNAPALARPAGVMDVNYCAETAVANLGFGSARLTWSSGTAQGSYGWNLWMASNYYTTDGANPDGRFPRERFFTKFFGAPPNAPFIGDSNWIGSWPDDVDFVPPNLERGETWHEIGYFMGRFSVARHGRSINLGFVDGSSSNVPLWDLWKQKWNQDFLSVERKPEEFKYVEN